MQCRSRRQPARHLILLAVSLLCASASFACLLFFPNDYLVRGGSDPLTLPQLSFEYEIYHILGQPALIGTPQQQATYRESDPAAKAMVEKDVAQFHDALMAASMPNEEVQRTLEEYRKMRDSMREQARNHRNWEAETAERKHWANGGYSPGAVIPVEPPAFDLASYESLLSRLPGEFSLYVRGATAYQNHDYETALQSFTKILDIAPEQRPYRTVWAAYMRAMVLLHLERFNDAMTAYTGIAELVRAGFADPLLLTNESIGWMAHIKLKERAIAEALSLYLDYYTHGDTAQRQSAVLSLDRVLRGLDRQAQADQLDKILGDERLREVLIAWNICHGGYPNQGEKNWLLAKLKELPTTSPLLYTDRIAWLAYYNGDFVAAEHWLQLSSPSSPISMWVHSKLLLRDGKLPEASEVLAKLAIDLEKSQDPERPGVQVAPKWYAYSADNNYELWTPDRIAYLDLGMVMFKRAAEDPKYYTDALDAFVKARSLFDTACVAEHNIPINDLVAYASTLAPTTEVKNDYFSERLPDIRHLCARRLAREGSLEQAIPFYPESLQDKAKSLLSDLKESRNPANAPRKRAENLIGAARITRKDGMELYGTALCPDWFSMNGEFDISSDYLPPGKLSWCREYPAKPNKRFHYRYVAAGLMWEAAQLMPDNDPLTATALYEGGSFLQNRDPKAADRFYKALVRRNPNLAVAQQANKLRWFPPKFDDRVMRTHPSRFALTPRRTKALIALSLAILVLAFVTVALRKRSRTKPSDTP
jgi:tetratricopeptide (TPR) repeat protein